MVQNLGCKLAAVRKLSAHHNSMTCLSTPSHLMLAQCRGGSGLGQHNLHVHYRHTQRCVPTHCIHGRICEINCSLSLQAGAAAMLSIGSVGGAAFANELDILNQPPPGTQHVIDDAGVLNKTTRKSLNDELSRLEARTDGVSMHDSCSFDAHTSHMCTLHRPSAGRDSSPRVAMSCRPVA